MLRRIILRIVKVLDRVSMVFFEGKNLIINNNNFSFLSSLKYVDKLAWITSLFFISTNDNAKKTNNYLIDS